MEDKVSIDELADIMRTLGMSSDEAPLYKNIVEANLSTVKANDDFNWPVQEKIEREWRYPSSSENQLGAWYAKTHIQTSKTGKLVGQKVAVKDNVLLASVPLMSGTSILEGYVPNEDAEIVSRLLAEGATITGKTVCEAYCLSGGSHTSATGPVRNPYDPLRTSGGSSSGSGVVVATGEVDAAIGCDQGGSIRVPASFCGIVGMKPTWGLVPYTGILGLSHSVDHTGPMTAGVQDNALMLDVLSAADGEDSRCANIPEQAPFVDALAANNLDGLRIGIVSEGFGLAFSQADVDSAVRRSAKSLALLGATVSEISIPMHARANILLFGSLPAITTSMFNLDGASIENSDRVPREYVERQSRWRERADELPANVKTFLISAELIRRRAGYRYIEQAKLGVRQLRKAYDKALEEVDVLVMPTTPMKALPLPPSDASPEVSFGYAMAPLANTSPFNYTHHPALSIPCAMSEGLPVGMMMIGRHFGESSLYRAAHIFEQSTDWRSSFHSA